METIPFKGDAVTGRDGNIIFTLHGNTYIRVSKICR